MVEDGGIDRLALDPMLVHSGRIIRLMVTDCRFWLLEAKET